ncbi:MAG: hypothetical protein Q9227_001365 [Pyrenula ochraceoflavens]
MPAADILIAPDQSDLNVYKTASNGTTEVGCCGRSSQKAQTGCCGGGTVAEKGNELDNINLNELAGSYKIYAVKSST